MSNIKVMADLINESTTTADNSNGRPSLLAITRATTQLIYQDLVATQPTSQPLAALYGLKYLNPLGKLSFVTGATFSGAIGTQERKTIPELSTANKDGFVKGDYFTFDDVVFKALSDDPFAGSTETELFDLVSEANAASTIRMVPDAANTEHFESPNSEISEAGFEIRKWQSQTKSRKFKTEVTHELLQDMDSNGFNSKEMIYDLLATQMAEEVNKDILQSLVTVSRRFKVDGVSPKGVLDLSVKGSSVEQARELYRYMCEMNASIQRNTSYSATYAVASSRVAAVLASSGWLTVKDDQPDSAYGVLNNGIVLYCDNNSPIDYVVVGVKANYGEDELIGSLFYAPYSNGLGPDADPTDHVGAYTVLNDSHNMQPKIALMLRYALCVNPYTMGIDDAQAKVIDTSNMDNFAGQSDMSMLLGVKLPKLAK